MGYRLLLLKEVSESPGGTVLSLSSDKEIIYDHAMSMLTENEVDGLIPFTLQNRNGKESLVYNISGKQSLKDIYAKKEADHREILIIFTGLSVIYKSLEEYLLDAADLLLSPEYIYMDISEKRLYFIYFPGYGGELSALMRELADFLIRKADHRDEKAVPVIYDFYKRVYAGDYSVEPFLEETQDFDHNSGEYESYSEEEYHNETYKGHFASEDRPNRKQSTQVQVKEKAPSKAVYVVCLMGLVLIILFLLIVMIYEPYTLTRYLYNKEVIAFIAAFGAVLVLIPALRVNQDYKRKRAGRRREVYYLSRDGNGSSQDIIIERLPFIIGKSEECDGMIAARAVSRKHAEIFKEEGEYCIRDLGSTNGTFIEGKEIKKERAYSLDIGMEISFGDRAYYFFKQET